MIWPPPVVMGSMMWQDVTWTSEIQTEEVEVLTDTPLLEQIQWPLVPFFTATSLDGSMQARLMKFPSISYHNPAAIHLV